MASSTLFPSENLANLFDEHIAALTGYSPCCITVTGSGGKTTAVERLARCWADQGQSVLVTTSTRLAHPSAHSYPFEHFHPLLPDAHGLPLPQVGQVVLFGAEAKGKLTAPPQEIITELTKRFDRVLVEGDGARGLPLKIHSERDPVVPVATELVISVVGLEALWKTLDDRVMYLSDRFRQLADPDSSTVTPQVYRTLLEHPEGLFKGSGDLPVIVLCNQSDAILPHDTECVLESMTDNWQGRSFDIICGSLQQDSIFHHAHVAGNSCPEGAYRESV